MGRETNKMLFALIRSAVDGKNLNENEKNGYSPDMLDDMLAIALEHDVLHLLALGMKQNNLLLPNDEMGIGKCIFKAVYRVEKIGCEYDALCEVLEKNCIAFLPLKGSVIRKYYPEEWMRTSCDIDVLVCEEDVDRAIKVLVDSGYTYRFKGTHNASLFAPNNTHLELHFTLVEKGLANEASNVLKDVWSAAKLKEGYSYFYEMTDEMFYFYHIAHMAKHFENGGCGIRPFIDLWVLDNIDCKDAEKRDKLLEEGKLLKFARTACNLSAVWFKNKEYDAVLQQMEDYILQGGRFGNNENRIAVKQQKSGGKFKYAVSKIFISYDTLKYHYPILQKHRWLMPAMQVRRWGKLIFCGHLKRTAEELKYSSDISDKEANKVREFLNNIGL